jgi:uncharacterized protein
MPVDPSSSLRSLMIGVIVGVLRSASSAFAGASEDCAAAYDRQDYAAAIRLCRPLAEQGDAKAQSALGSMYELGHGVPHDFVASAKWYRKAAEQGYARAQSALGFIYLQSALGFRYFTGAGVQKDYAEAVQWYRKAAEQGDSFGQGQLGSMYELGHGVPQDYVLAHMWYNLAAAPSRADPDDYVGLDPTVVAETNAEMRDEVAAKMTPDQIAEAQRLAREWKPTK